MTTVIDKINDEVKKMGYILVTPRRTPIPSFYKLKDGTILGATVIVNHVLPNPSNPNDVVVNSDISFKIFVPANKRKQQGKRLVTQEEMASSIVDEDVQYDTLREEFNEYNLSNKAIISVKTIVSQINTTSLYNEQGEPIYQINAQPIFKFKNNRSR